jgi:hypothetical protein
MLRNSRPSVVLESGVWVRRASQLPALGRGRVAVLGEAAHPMRPSSQEENQVGECGGVDCHRLAMSDLSSEALVGRVTQWGVEVDARSRAGDLPPSLSPESPLQALEDAAVLGACVAAAGLSKEALRRYEAERAPRWRHVMQLAMAANCAPSATSSGLSQALLVRGMVLASCKKMGGVLGEPTTS